MINTLESCEREEELRRGSKALISRLQKSHFLRRPGEILRVDPEVLQPYARIRTVCLSQGMCQGGQLGKRGSRALLDLLQDCLQLLVGDGAGHLNGSRLKACPSQKGCFANGRTGGFCQCLAMARSVAELGQAALLSADLCLAHLPPGCLARFPSCSSCLES